ncbi:MAG: hypothetical protein KZQ66_13965 [Candidatus Thiodiazotropha sp. (ex Lucinoma aequizonata)]|nr:hypothetical protein [Candidatus Thiodiazotropha sp. (ex Lucinoma aequizonata)]MCU7902962.1 hypothetical protein [Candidatus Thiodiazotropha sp. (ex Lucinoma aequizonata)]
MSTCYNVGRIVVNALLEAEKDGQIDNEEIVDIINDCAKLVGLSVRLAQVGVDDQVINQRMDEVKAIDEMMGVHMEKSTGLIQKQLKLERRAYSARKSLQQAISETEVTGIPDGKPERRKRNRLLICLNKTNPRLHEEVANEVLHEDMHPVRGSIEDMAGQIVQDEAVKGEDGMDPR